MSAGQVADLTLRWIGALGVPSAAAWWLNDRRKSKVAARVAERSEDADVRIKGAGALDAEVAVMARAFQEERESYERHAAYQDRQIRELTAKVDQQSAEIATLRHEVAELRGALGVSDQRMTDGGVP